MNQTTITFLKQAVKFLNLALDDETIRTYESETIFNTIVILEDLIKSRQRLKVI